MIVGMLILLAILKFIQCAQILLTFIYLTSMKITFTDETYLTYKAHNIRLLTLSNKRPSA